MAAFRDAALPCQNAVLPPPPRSIAVDEGPSALSWTFIISFFCINGSQLSPGGCGRRVAFNASNGAEIKSNTNQARSPSNECRAGNARAAQDHHAHRPFRDAAVFRRLHRPREHWLCGADDE